MLSSQTIATVKATAPVMRVHGLNIVVRMYELLLRDPNIRALFDPTHQRNGTQHRALAEAVVAYAENIDNLAALGPAVERIAARHVALNIQPQHYDAVAVALIQAVRDTLGAAATPDIITAWTEAFGALQTILTQREEQLYSAGAETPGGWRGYRPFRLQRVIPESRQINSFYFAPIHGQLLPVFKAGQYLTLRLTIPGYGPLLRHYSISSAATERTYFRISVKREDAPEPDVPEGLGSLYLHRQAMPGMLVDIAPPAGVFTLPDGQQPLVLIGGGIGITPLLSMLETLVATQPTRALRFIHAVRNRAHHAFGAEVRDAIRKLSHASADFFYEDVSGDAVPGVNYTQIGRPDPAWVVRSNPHPDALYLVCGPRNFMRYMIQGLRAQGVPANRILYEFFGATDEDLLTAEPIAA